MNGLTRSLVLGGSGPNASYTAAQLSAMAAAGTLVPYATYVASDTEVWYRATGVDTYLAIGYDHDAALYEMATSDILPTVGAVTSLVPSTPANEYITTTGAYSTTEGSLTWGGHQSTMVRMSDQTVFAIALESADLLLRRSATGGTYGGAWTTVATISNASRAVIDLDAHLLRNPVTDQVHLIATDSTNRLRVRTYHSAGTLVSDVLVPDAYPGYDATKNWLRDGGTAGTAYSSASIGSDGTIAICRAVTSTPPAYVPNMVAGLQVQTLKWNGATWKFSGARMIDVGERMSYNRVWVSPPGHEGYIVGLGMVDVKWGEWTQARNPYYSAEAWPNTEPVAGASKDDYFGGSFPEIRAWKLPLHTLSAISIKTVLPAQYRTTDVPASPTRANFGGHKVFSVSMDYKGRIWFSYNSAPDFTTLVRYITVLNTDLSTAYTVTNPGGVTFGSIEYHHHDLAGNTWLGFQYSGSTPLSIRVLSTSESGGTLTVQNYAAATDIATGALGQNLTTARWETWQQYPRMCDERNGSTRTHNWFEVVRLSSGDYTGTAPGTTPVNAADGSMKAKRVRIQLPI